jgi:hypothetical protein
MPSALLLALLGFFTGYGHPFTGVGLAAGARPSDPELIYSYEARGILGILLQTGLGKVGLLISPYSVRSERAACEELEYRLLRRWFPDMSQMEPASTSLPSERTVVDCSATLSLSGSSIRTQSSEDGARTEVTVAADGGPRNLRTVCSDSTWARCIVVAAGGTEDEDRTRCAAS